MTLRPELLKGPPTVILTHFILEDRTLGVINENTEQSPRPFFNLESVTLFQRGSNRAHLCAFLREESVAHN